MSQTSGTEYYLHGVSFADANNGTAVGGTILHTTRTNPFRSKDGPDQVLRNVKQLGLDVLIAVGGEDTLSVGAKFSQLGLKVVGVPKTIDNDIVLADVTFGFDSAVNVTVEAIDRIQTTAESHDRIMVIEVMGRHAVWIAAYAGIASGANLTLVPETPIEISEICDLLKKRHDAKRMTSIVVVGEGCNLKDHPTRDQSKVDEFGHARLGGIGEILAREIEKRVGIETRAVVLGHVVRGGPPSAYDRILATRLGVAAVDEIKNQTYGIMVCLRGNVMSHVQLTDILGKMKNLDAETISLLNDFSE